MTDGHLSGDVDHMVELVPYGEAVNKALRLMWESEEGWDGRGIGKQANGSELIRVRCRRGHDAARVYRTPYGLLALPMRTNRGVSIFDGDQLRQRISPGELLDWKWSPLARGWRSPALFGCRCSIGRLPDGLVPLAERVESTGDTPAKVPLVTNQPA